MSESLIIATVILGAAWWGWAIENVVGVPSWLDDRLDDLSISTEKMLCRRGLVAPPTRAEIHEMFLRRVDDLEDALREMSEAALRAAAATVTAWESAFSSRAEK